MSGKANGWTITKRFVGSQTYSVGSNITFKLPRNIVAAGFTLNFSGTTNYNTLSATAQPRATARALGLITLTGRRKGQHKGWNCPNVPAHMLQLREQVLTGLAPQETAITTTQGAFSLNLPVRFYDPRLEDKSEMVAQLVDLSQYDDPYITIQTGNLLGASGDNDNVALVGTATSATITAARVNLTAWETNLPLGLPSWDPDFEYFFDVQTAANQMKNYTLNGKEVQAYEIIETVTRGATAIETQAAVVPNDGAAKIHLRVGNKPYYEDYGPNIQGDNFNEFFKNLTSTPAGLYIIDKYHHSLQGPIDFTGIADRQYLDIDNSSASALSVTDVKMRALHLTYNK